MGVGDGQGSLTSCSSWGCKESDMTEWLNWNETEVNLLLQLQSNSEENIQHFGEKHIFWLYHKIVFSQIKNNMLWKLTLDTKDSTFCLLYISNGLPCCFSGKQPTCLCKRHKFVSWVRMMPCRKKWQPSSVFLPGKSHGQRILTGYSPWGSQRVGHDLVYKQQIYLIICLLRIPQPFFSRLNVLTQNYLSNKISI